MEVVIYFSEFAILLAHLPICASETLKSPHQHQTRALDCSRLSWKVESIIANKPRWETI